MIEFALALVIGCVGEIGYQETPRECLIMWHGQAEKHRVGYEPAAIARQIKNYNPVWKRRRSGAWLIDTFHARAARSTRLDCSRPPDLRAKLTWTRTVAGRSYSRRESCLGIVAAAFDFLEGKTEHPCPRARDYGGAMDTPPACALRIYCGDTLQRYWLYRPCARLDGRTLPASVASGRR